DSKGKLRSPVKAVIEHRREPVLVAPGGGSVQRGDVIEGDGTSKQQGGGERQHDCRQRETDEHSPLALKTKDQQHRDHVLRLYQNETEGAAGPHWMPSLKGQYADR